MTDLFQNRLEQESSAPQARGGLPLRAGGIHRRAPLKQGPDEKQAGETVLENRGTRVHSAGCIGCGRWLAALGLMPGPLAAPARPAARRPGRPGQARGGARQRERAPTRCAWPAITPTGAACRRPTSSRCRCRADETIGWPEFIAADLPAAAGRAGGAGLDRRLRHHADRQPRDASGTASPTTASAIWSSAAACRCA